MRPPFFYPPSYMPVNYTPVPRFQPFMRPPQIPFPAQAAISPQTPFPTQTPFPSQLPIPQAQAPLTGFLANAQSLFEQAQKFTPYMQQAAPMMKNLPALWRMYKGFKQDSSLESSVERPPRKPVKQVEQSYTQRPSVPKIYQPPYSF